jgi:hypothetical protein
VDPDGPASDVASTPTEGWTPPPWTADPDTQFGWTPPPWSPDAADTRPFWRRIPAGWLEIAGVFLLLGAVVGLAIIGADTTTTTGAPSATVTVTPSADASRSATDEPEEVDEDLNSDETNIDDSVDLRVGDCFDLKHPLAEIEHVKKVPCTAEHDYELFYVGAMRKRSHPTEDAILDYVIDYCDPAFGHYIGKDVDDSDLDYDWLLPTEDAWRSGDRTVQCAAYDPNNSLLKGSLRGAHR